MLLHVQIYQEGRLTFSQIATSLRFNNPENPAVHLVLTIAILISLILNEQLFCNN